MYPNKTRMRNMSNLHNIKLRDVIPLAEKLFASFGVKSMIALQGNEWINILTLIQLTRRNIKDLNNEYHFQEERLGKIDCPNFKITLQAKPIQEFSKLISELQSGYLKIGEIQTRLLAKNPQTILDQGIGYSGNILQVGEYREYKFYSATMSMDDQANMILHKYNISPSSFGLKDNDELARSWLGISSLQNSTNIQVTIPIYATAEIQYQGGNEIKVTLKIDQHLLNNSQIWLIRTGQGDRSPILERRSYKLASCDNTLQDGFIYTKLTHKFLAVNLGDNITVSLTNKELGELVRKDCSI